MATKAQVILKNTASYMLSSIIEGLLGFVITLIIARHLGQEGLGKYSFAFAFVAIAAIFADLGLETYMVREIARNKKLTKTYVDRIFTLKIILGILFIGIIPLLIFFVTQKDLSLLPMVVLASIALLFDRLRYVFNAVFVAHERVEFSLIVGVIERSVAVILLWALIPYLHLFGVFIALVFSYGVAYLASMYIIRSRFMHPSFVIDWHAWKKMVYCSLPFWFSSLFMIIYYKTDTLMLSYLKGYDAVGWYTAAYTLVFALTFIPSAVITAVYPVMSQYYQHSHTLLKDLFQNCFRYLVIIALPIIAGTFILSPRIILFIYDNGFSPSSSVLQILIISILFLFVSYLMGHLFNSIHKQIYFTISTGICAALNVILNFFLIPQWSYNGAALATVITEAINFFILFYFCFRWNLSCNLFTIFFKPLIAVGIMVGVILFFSDLHLLLLVPIAGVVYGSILLLLQEIGAKERALLRLFIKK